MGIEPFLLSSSLIGVLAQRLVRVLCEHCKQPYRPAATECEKLGLDPSNPPTLYKPQGCPECNRLGYRGRAGIFELIEVDDAMRGMIHEGASEQEMDAFARKSGPGIREDGLRQILAGTTSVEEVMRVTQEG